ncbi:MAG: enoyl-CoA hydratase/isomerase family protein [Sphingobium sp.]
MDGIDHVEAERYSALGMEPIVWIDLADDDAQARARRLRRDTSAVVGGVDRAGHLPPVDDTRFDLLLSAHPAPPRPWVANPDPAAAARAMTDAVLRAPVAASVTVHLLRVGGSLDFAGAIALESLAYSTLLGGDAFRRWRAAHPGDAGTAPTRPYLRFEREGDVVTVTLDDPAGRNGMAAGMRDALHEALCAVLDDPSRPRLILQGDGACFSTGGALGEFGTATDLAGAHAIRTLRSCARRLHELGDRAQVILHGACIGSGIEIPAAAAHRHARPDAFFQLPELAMGLVPGAGGTVTVPRAIGRHRACYMMLSGRRIARRVAVDWGLVAPASA